MKVGGSSAPRTVGGSRAVITGVVVLGLGSPTVHAWAAPVQAGPPPPPPSTLAVAIIVSPPNDLILAETGLRLRSELGAAGIDGRFADCSVPDAAELQACAGWLTTRVRSEDTTNASLSERHPEADPDRDSARERDADAAAANPAAANHAAPVAPETITPSNRVPAGATIALAREDRAVTIEVVNKVTEGWKLFRLVYVSPVAGRDDSSVLAIRAVELLRDLRRDLQRCQAERPSTAPSGPLLDAPAAAPIVVSSSSSSSSSSLTRWQISGGAMVLSGRSGLGPSWGPSLGLSAELGTGWSAVAALAGPFFNTVGRGAQPPGAAAASEAATRQELALVGLRRTLGWTRARPFATLAAGIYHLRATFPAGATTPGGAEGMWVPMAAAGIGVAFPVSSWLSLVAEAGAMVTAPRGEVTIGGELVASAGAPSLLAQAGAWISL